MLAEPQAALGQDASPSTPAQAVADLGNAVNLAVGTLRPLTLTYLLAGTYVAITTSAVSDRDLLVGADLQLPLLGTSVGLTDFFWMAPLLFVVLHGNLLMHLYLVAERTRLFETQIARLPTAEARAQARSLVAPFPFIEWQVDPHAGLIRSAAFRLLSWILYIALPLALLLFMQLRSLPYQDLWISSTQTAAMLLDAALIALFWRPGGSAPRPWGFKDGQGRWQVPAAHVLPAALIGVVCLGSGLVTLGQLLQDYTGTLFATHLSAQSAILMKREPPQESIIALRAEAIDRSEPPEIGEERAYLSPNLAVPLDLAGRSLRRANLQQAKLYGVVLRGADLKDAHLRHAILPKAELYRADLRGADLRGARLPDANVCINNHAETPKEAREQCTADFRGARLDDADLRGARLRGADFTDASLINAKLQGADLSQAQLNGAQLSGAQLAGALLCGTQLARANLASVNLAAADLSPAAKGCGQLPANLHEAEFSPASDLRYTDLRGVIDVPPPAKAPSLNELVARGQQAYEDPAAPVAPAGPASPSLWRPESLPAGQVAHLIVGSTTPASLERLIANSASPTRDLNHFYLYLINELTVQLCQTSDIATKTGLIRHWWLLSIGQSTGHQEMVARLAKSVLKQRDCPLDRLPPGDQAFLTDQAKRAPDDQSRAP